MVGTTATAGRPLRGADRPAPTGRVLIAFDDTTLEPNPTWTRLDDTPGLVATYTIDRGRVFELDRTDGGRATVRINDQDGILDPTNPSGPYYGKIEPLLQITLGRYNPVLGQWQTRFRGFIGEYDYEFDPSQQVNYLSLNCVDLFEILQSAEMLESEFGNYPPPDDKYKGQVYFNDWDVQSRIIQILTDAGIPTDFYVTFSGNVYLYPTVYSIGESALTAIQEAVDGEWPGVSNFFCDRFGRAVFHGRLAKFDPANTAAVAGNGAWDWHHWHAGDHAAVLAAPSTTAQIREFAMNRGLSKIINSALATPIGIDDADVTGLATLLGGSIYRKGQQVYDTASRDIYGTRSWSAQNLLTAIGLLDNSDELVETRRFANYYVQNYAEPRNRVTLLGFRSRNPGVTGAAILWRLLTEVDIADQIDITVASPGGGGLSSEPFFVEGIHETSRPLSATWDDVTLELDVSPTAYFLSNPFPTN